MQLVKSCFINITIGNFNFIYMNRCPMDAKVND